MKTSTKTIKFYKAKSVTVFDSIGKGRRTKTSPETYENVYCTITSNTINIFIPFKFRMNVITKRTTSKYFEFNAKEIKVSSFKKAIKKIEKTIELNTKKRKTLNVVKSLVNVVKLEQAMIAANKVAREKTELIKGLVLNLKNSVDQSEWHDKANQIVGHVGYNFVKILGFKETLNIAKSL